MRTVRKIRVVGLALFAVFAFSAFAATAAFAEDELLFKGEEILTALSSEVEVELLMIDTKAATKLEYMCSGIFDGTFEGKLFFIKELLMLDKTLLNELGVLNGAGDDMIDCLVLLNKAETTTCEEAEAGAKNALLTVNLGTLNGLTTLWKVDIILDSGGQYLAHFLTTAEANEEDVVTPQYTLDCLNALLGLIEDICEGLSSARLLVDLAGNLRSWFNQLSLTEEWGAESELRTCSLGGAASGEVISELEGAEDTEESGGIFKIEGGGALTLS